MATFRWRPIGTTIGVPDTGSAMTRHGSPNTSVDELGRDDLGRRALGDDRAVAHGDEVVGVAAGQVEVVQHEHDRAALALG